MLVEIEVVAEFGPHARVTRLDWEGHWDDEDFVGWIRATVVTRTQVCHSNHKFSVDKETIQTGFDGGYPGV